MNLKVIILSICIFVWALPPVFCEEKSEWLTLRSNYFTIEYESSVNMKSVLSKLNQRGLFSGGFLGSSSSSATTPAEEVAQRLDALLKRVEGILDMYPPNLKLAIKIFNDSGSLEDAYFRMLGTRKEYQAFYIYEYRTIFTSAYTISDSVMSHEMAHAVIDDYFSANPPPKIAEILATYVDAHLED